MLTTITLGVTSLGALSPASAALPATGVGPIDPANNFPSYYQDTNGVALEMCQAGLPNCLAGPELIQDVHAAGGDAEAFYYMATTDVGGFTMDAALEAAYLADGPDQEMTFMRTQATGKGVTPNGKYTFTDPYGTYTCTADATGLVQPAKGCRFETGAIPGNFNAALGGRLGPFLTWDTFGSTGAGAPPAGYIGDNTTPHAVVGSPTGFNKMRVSGPGITGTCTDADGTVTKNCAETDKIIIQGKTVDTGKPAASLSAGTVDFGDVPATPVTKTLTYANTGSVPVTISAVDLAGTGAAAFSQSNTCGALPATVAVGAKCAFDVTFTPTEGKSSAATLTITDDTPTATRAIALKGSNLPKMFVSDPAPPAALTFGSQSTTAASAENNVVIGNSGNGPLTVASVALTGTSAAHFKLGPSNTCKTTVLPDGGCEIGVMFAPTTAGGKTANLRVTDGNGVIVNVPLTGTGTTPPPDSTPPTAPSLTGSRTGTTANLSWSAATDNVGVTGYQVFRNGTQVGANLPATARTLSDAALTPGTYSYTVKAMDAAGNAAPSSNTVAITVPTPDTAPPTVTAQSPAVNATNVPVANNVTATFSEDVQGVGGTTVFLRDAGSTTNVPATVTYNATTRVATLDPTASLANSTQYTATLTGGATAIRDTSNNPLANASWSFTTAAAVVADPTPTVTGRTPAVAGTNVPVTDNVTATFSEPMQGVSGTTFFLRAAGSTTNIAATVTQNGTTNQWILNPTANLANNTQYTASLTGSATAIRDSANQPLPSTSWTFTTAAAATTTNAAPTVTARAPAVNGVGAAVANNITATFSEAVNGVSGTTFTLKNAATGAAIAAVVSRNGTTNQWILNPNANLAVDTKYTVTLTGGATAIRDAAGAPLATTTWSFTSGPAPTVTARTPAVNATAISRTANVNATFSEAVAGVSGTTFQLKNPAGTVISAVVSRNGTTNQWILNPGVTLAANTKYTVTLTGGGASIRDNAGNPLSTTSWAFTTGA